MGLLATVVFATLILIAFAVSLVLIVRKNNKKYAPIKYCTCGMTPQHLPDVESCRAVNVAAGREVTPMGFVLSRDKAMFFDGVDWLPNKGYKPRLDAENFEEPAYGRGSDG